jgi:hypothetical protein
MCVWRNGMPGQPGALTNPAIDIINPATKYIAYRALSLPLIKAGLAEKGCPLVKSRNTELSHACSPYPYNAINIYGLVSH